MPPRRSHKKSRAGCGRCKQRKIKCDEIHPSCANCLKHGVSCDFDSPDAAVQQNPVEERQSTEDLNSIPPLSTPSSPSASITPLFNSPGASSSTVSRYSPTSRLMELRLLHNYTARTSKTLAATPDPSIEEAWQIAVPDLALESPCLMDAMLAVSALHLRALYPEDQELVRASHGYMASALSQYSSCLVSGVGAVNAEALFITSALIAFQASASRRFLIEDRAHDLTADGYQLPVQWFHAFQGVKTVVLSSWRWLRESKRVGPIIQSQPALALDLNPDHAAFFGTLLEGLDEHLEAMEEPRKSETRQAYEHSVAYLNFAHPKPERPCILGFPATVSRRFVELIDHHDPRALVIVACFFAMIKAVDDVWWLQGVVRREVDGIMSLLPREWWSKIDWAVRLAHHEGPIDAEIWGHYDHSEGQLKKEDDPAGDIRSHIDILARLDPI